MKTVFLAAIAAAGTGAAVSVANHASFLAISWPPILSFFGF